MGIPSQSPPQRSPAGISTVPVGFLMADYPRPSPMNIHEVFTDFDRFAATDWTQTLTGAGTIALTNGNGGQLLLTTAATGADIAALQTSVLDYNVIPGARIWFSVNFQLSDANLSQFQAGLANTFAALAPTDGIFFNKPSGGTVINLVLSKGGVQTTIPLAIGGVPVNLVAATVYTLGFVYDGKPTPSLYAFFSVGMATPLAFSQPYYPGSAQILATASADPAAAFPLTNLPLPATGLVAGFALKAGAAAAKTATVDYFLATNEVLRF